MEDQTRWDGYAGPLAFQPRHFAIVAAARITPGMRVLDVATGRGETAILAAQSGARVVASDIGEELVKTAQSNAVRAGVSIMTAVADMRVLQGIEPGFDVVLGCAALHHLDEADARRAVVAAMRLLVPGGRALFLEPVENVGWFDFVKHCFPGPKQRGKTERRPSSLNRRAWADWLQSRDDRWMSDAELLSLWPHSRIVARLGVLQRVASGPVIKALDDRLLRVKWIGRLAQSAIVEYRACDAARSTGQ